MFKYTLVSVLIIILHVLFICPRSANIPMQMRSLFCDNLAGGQTEEQTYQHDKNITFFGEIEKNCVKCNLLKPKFDVAFYFVRSI